MMQISPIKPTLPPNGNGGIVPPWMREPIRTQPAEPLASAPRPAGHDGGQR